MSVPLRKDECEIEPISESVRATPGDREYNVARKANAHRRNQLLLATVGVSLSAGIALGLTAAPLLASSREPDGLKLLAVQTDANAPALESATADRRLGFITVSGSLRSSQRLGSTEAVVQLLDRENHTLRVERALVTQTSAGGTAPFQVLLPDITNAAAYRIYFQALPSAVTKSL